MSKYSLHINRFLVNSLVPEINKLNTQLASMEEFGFANGKLLQIRKRVNKLIPAYDFLNEYVVGEEEAEWDVLYNLMRMTGLSMLDNRSIQPMVETTTNSESNYNTNPTDSELITVYVGKEIYDGSLLPSGESYISIVAPSDIDKMVVVDHTGNPKTYKKPVAKFSGIILPSGLNKFQVQLWRDGSVVHSAIVTIQSE